MKNSPEYILAGETWLILARFGYQADQTNACARVVPISSMVIKVSTFYMGSLGNLLG